MRKRCCQCRMVLAERDFPRLTARLDGLRPQCRTCHRANCAQQRAQRAAAPGSYTKQDVLRLYADQQGRCYWCRTFVGERFHLDHAIPLARGGTNNPDNLRISCPTCNLSKGAKLPEDFLLSITRKVSTGDEKSQGLEDSHAVVRDHSRPAYAAGIAAA